MREPGGKSCKNPRSYRLGAGGSGWKDRKRSSPPTPNKLLKPSSPFQANVRKLRRVTLIEGDRDSAFDGMAFMAITGFLLVRRLFAGSPLNRLESKTLSIGFTE